MQRALVRLGIPGQEDLAELSAREDALSETIKDSELTDPQLPLETALWRLYHEEEVRVLQSVPLAKGCRCNFDYIKAVIGRFPPEERAEMVDEDGFISVDCEFCSRVFPISLSDFAGR